MKPGLSVNTGPAVRRVDAYNSQLTQSHEQLCISPAAEHVAHFVLTAGRLLFTVDAAIQSVGLNPLEVVRVFKDHETFDARQAAIVQLITRNTKCSQSQESRTQNSSSSGTAQ